MRPKTSGVTKEIKIKRCYGCGAILQSDNRLDSGYIPKEKLQSNDEQLCERCYRLRHYNEDSETPHFNEDFAKILKEAKKKDALLVLVLDSFSFVGSLEPSLVQTIKDLELTKILVLLNKRDVLPRSYSDEKIVSHIKRELNSLGLNPLDMLLISSLKNYNLDELMEKINLMRENRDVYFIGVSQVGKSSIINSLLKNYQNRTDKFITTSRYPGTTIDVIRIPLDNKSYMFDTAGIFNGKSLINNVERQILKYIIPRNEIAPRIYQVSDKQSFLLGAIARLDFVKGAKTNFTFVLSNEVKITRTKLEKAVRTFDSLIITKDTKPISRMITESKDLVKTHLVLPNDSSNKAINIAGFGVIILEAKGQEIDVFAPANVLVDIEDNPWY
ncbi:MAG TPA: ribosome biogenesis GTPase YqeH [Firmicutes bacterium]|nr:ribosome biogenesis GTPase YqeH [Bacillota bacterium]